MPDLEAEQAHVDADFGTDREYEWVREDREPDEFDIYREMMRSIERVLALLDRILDERAEDRP